MVVFCGSAASCAGGECISRRATATTALRTALRFKTRKIPLQIQHQLRPAAHGTTYPQWLVKNLLKTTHAGISGLISNRHRQLGFVAQIIIQPIEVCTATRKDEPSIINITRYFSRKLRERRRDDFPDLANHLVGDRIGLAGRDLDSSGTS